jgi:hypothetical protein
MFKDRWAGCLSSWRTDRDRPLRRRIAIEFANPFKFGWWPAATPVMRDARPELLWSGKLSMMRFMSDEEIGEIRDELREYKQQLDGKRHTNCTLDGDA